MHKLASFLPSHWEEERKRPRFFLGAFLFLRRRWRLLKLFQTDYHLGILEQSNLGEAGSGWIIPALISNFDFSFDALCLVADLVYTNLSRGRDLDLIYSTTCTQTFGPTVARRGDLEKNSDFFHQAIFYIRKLSLV